MINSENDMYGLANQGLAFLLNKVIARSNPYQSPAQIVNGLFVAVIVLLSKQSMREWSIALT